MSKSISLGQNWGTDGAMITPKFLEESGSLASSIFQKL